nr:MAG TPA: hypothetical protein [Crassvirales sp.]
MNNVDNVNNVIVSIKHNIKTIGKLKNNIDFYQYKSLAYVDAILNRINGELSKHQ